MNFLCWGGEEGWGSWIFFFFGDGSWLEWAGFWFLIIDTRNLARLAPWMVGAEDVVFEYVSVCRDLIIRGFDGIPSERLCV